MTKIEGFLETLAQLERERGVSRELLLKAVEAALLSAAKKRFHEELPLEVKIGEGGEIKVLATRKVVKKVANKEMEISLAEAKAIDPKAKVRQMLPVEVTPSDFGRLAAQTAKQVIIQRIREAEKETVFDEFKDKIGEIVTGIVQRREFGGYLVNLGHIETILPPQEQIMNERYQPKDRIKVYVVEVKKTSRGPVVVISRTHPNLVRKLFELEIPEIKEGILEIKNIAREPGRRAKVAIYSKDPNVGAVGTCVGPMGSRIQNIVKELGQERVDIVEWSEDPKAFISAALSPAKPVEIEIKEELHAARVIVLDDQQSLAIGREGQNVRLASRLTGWKIDIVSQSQAKQVEKPAVAVEAAAEAVVAIDAEDKKFRVHLLAKELGVTSREVMEVLAKLGVAVKGPTSVIDKESREKVIAELGKEPDAQG